jgi:hypothetical protein
MMMSSVWIVAAQAGAVTVSTPPPIYVPAHRYPMQTNATREPFRSAVLDVEVRGGDHLLWSGPMRVSTQSGASLDRRQSDASPEQCGAPERGYGGGDREALSINLSMRDAPVAFLAVRATWERPLDQSDCRGGTRTVSFNETFPIEPGKAKTIKADGGLTVTLRPR